MNGSRIEMPNRPLLSFTDFENVRKRGISTTITESTQYSSYTNKTRGLFYTKKIPFHDEPGMRF